MFALRPTNWLYPLLLGLLLGLLLLAGCDRGPSEQALQSELQQRLDTHFQQGLFAIHDFHRTGSAPFRDLENDVSGVHSYYDAELVFKQEYSLTQWKGLNLGTLAFAIGANEAGIQGFRLGGNKRGDLLRIHGRFSYADDGKGGWHTLVKKASPPPLPQSEEARAREGPGPKAVLADARTLLEHGIETGADTENAVIAQELGHAVSRIDLRLARMEGKLTLGSGQMAGTYHAFGQVLSDYANRQGLPMYSAETAGSVENASRLQSGRLEFGLVQSDVAQLLYEGWRQEGFFPNADLRAVASLWPEAVHLVTLGHTGIRSLEDLRGRRVAIGVRGSGSRVNAILIGLAAALQPEDIPVIREIGLARAIDQLERGEVDAVFLTEGVPAPAIQALAARHADLYFIPMPESLLEQLSDQHFAYYPVTVAARTYPGQTEPFTTLGLAAALMTSVHVSDDKVEALLELLLTGADELARKYYRAAFISRETMRLGLAVPLHPAAHRFYERYDRSRQEEQLAPQGP